MNRRFLKYFVLIFFVTVGIAACDEVDAPPLKVGTNVWPGYEPGYLARDLGYFSENEIKLRQFQSATESIRAFRNGVIDVAALTLDEALLLAQDGFDISVFLVADVSHGGDVIMANPNVGSIAGLKGKRIGVENNALGAYVLARALEIHGIDLADVSVHPITVDQSESVYKQGSVDAVVTFEPFRSHLMKIGAIEIFTSKDMPNEIVDVLVVRSEVTEKFADSLKKLSESWLKAVTYIEERPQEAGKLLGTRLGLTPEEALASFDGLVIPNASLNRLLLADGPDSLRQSALRLKRVLRDKGLLVKDIDIDGIFSDRFLQK